MGTIDRRLQSWNAKRAADEEERQRLAILHGPRPTNPDYLTRLVKVRVLGVKGGPGFLAHGGVHAMPGDVVELEFHMARDFASIGRVEMLEEP